VIDKYAKNKLCTRLVLFTRFDSKSALVVPVHSDILSGNWKCEVKQWDALLW